MATSRWLSISLMALKLVYLNKTKSIFTSKKPLSECCVFLKRRLHGRLRVLELGHRAVRVKCCPVNKTLVSGFISLREMIKLSSILSLKCHQHDIGGEDDSQDHVRHFALTSIFPLQSGFLVSAATPGG